jgi:hypothetical protein
MTSLVSETTLAVARAAAPDRLALGPAVVVIAVLAVLLVEREVLRAMHPSGTAPRLRGFDLVIAPLLLAFGLITATRLVDLLP